FFFFQAEDGIRDRTVTGVQTCALPISYPRFRFVVRLAACICRNRTTNRNRGYARPMSHLATPTIAVSTSPRARTCSRFARRRRRSEERRVGKECRSRWARDQVREEKVV